MFGIKKEKEAPAPVVKAEPVAVPEEPSAPETPQIRQPRTLIGPGIRFNGNIEASEDIEINGSVEGNIHSGNTITVTKGGSIYGDIAAEHFILEGSCEGTARIAAFCKIGSEGGFTGELYTPTLVTEEGSSFEGTLHLKPAKPEPVFEPAAPAEESVEETEKDGGFSLSGEVDI